MYNLGKYMAIFDSEEGGPLQSLLLKF